MKNGKSVGLDLDLTYAVAQAANANDLRSVAERFAAVHDFSYWIYVLAGPNTVLTNYPKKLVEAYSENRWYYVDPVIDAIHQHHRALSWDLRTLSPPKRQTDAIRRRLMECRQDWGIRIGVSAPAYEQRGNPLEYVIVSFSRARPLSEAAKRLHEPQVQLFAAYFLSVAQPIFFKRSATAAQETPALTQRERDCLTWAAMGKSSWEIGQVLGISEATVNFHLGNAAAKLQVRGRICAVAQAIRQGLINPV